MSAIPRPIRSAGPITQSRLPVLARPQASKSPSTLSVKSTPTAASPRASVSALPRATTLAQRKPIAREGFLSPKTVWGTVSHAQGPKYQLRDPGVTAPVRSTLPRAVRPKAPLAPAPSQSAQAVPKASEIPCPVAPPADQSSSTKRPDAPSYAIPVRATHALLPDQDTPASPSLSLDIVGEDGTAPAVIDLDKTPTMAVRQTSSTSIASTTTSSCYSSASSMARARAAAAHLEHCGTTDFPDPLDSGHPRELTLTWIPEPPPEDLDPAEELWRQLEIKMGRRLRPASIKHRGQWVAESALDCPEGMMRQTSDFSISAYYDDETQSVEGSALFDMSAPLIPSVSTSAATPANTPCIRRETLQRNQRVKKSRDGSFAPSMSRTASTDSSSSDSTEDVSCIATEYTDLTLPDEKPVKSGARMYRLDSHIVSALHALQADIDTPLLDHILGMGSPDADADEELDAILGGCKAKGDEIGGLGLGMPLTNHSIYHLPTLSPRMRPSRIAQAAKSNQGMRGEVASGLELAMDILQVKDLDTGEFKALSVTDTEGG